MSKELTCFLISPIGEQGTDVRKAADDFFHLIVQPAVEKYGFTVLRADEIVGHRSINEEILRHVQDSDLCIVDLTGQNPYVFYECGRRHESGRPCIQLIEASERTPLDLGGIQTIKYRLGDAQSIGRSVSELQSVIDEVQGSGYSEPASGASMSAIATVLTRIERRLANMEAARQPPKANPRTSLFTNPLKATHDAIVQGDLPTLVALLQRLESTIGIDNVAAIQTALVVATNGIAAGEAALKQALSDNRAKLKPILLRACVSGLVQYFVTKGEERSGYEFLKPMVDKILDERSDLDDSNRAFLHNQISILQHGFGDYAGGLASLRSALELSPEDRSYWYNISIIYDLLAHEDKACEASRKSIANLDSPDTDHLMHAIEVFAKAGKSDDAALAIETLKRIDPDLADSIAM
jgi:tetratricopeptide (TPR) repeat protein